MEKEILMLQQCKLHWIIYITRLTPRHQISSSVLLLHSQRCLSATQVSVTAVVKKKVSNYLPVRVVEKIFDRGW